MRFVLFFLLVFGSFFLVSIGVLTRDVSPDKLIVGKWEEVSWEFEKVDYEREQLLFSDDDFQRNEICKDMLIHKAEVWDFREDGKLLLIGKDQTSEVLDWHIKGRGHILVLKHGDDRIESFQIQDISKDSFVIHFGFDLQVKGIVKMTFKKVKDNNA